MTKITEFTNKHNVEMEFHLHYVKDLRDSSDKKKQNSNWIPFQIKSGSKKPGLTCIFGDQTNKLNGGNIRTHSTDIGAPMSNALSKENKNKDGFLFNDNDFVLSIIMEKEHYMPASLKNHIKDMEL